MCFGRTELRPYWYLRYRVRLYNEQTKKFERKEKWQRLGYCDEMTKREAERRGTAWLSK